MKKATDLLANGYEIPEVKPPEMPVSYGLDILSTLDGRKLEIMTRTNKAIVDGLNSGYAFAACYDSAYIRSRLETLMRLAISSNGKGREDVINAIRAGGVLPESFFNRPGGNDIPISLPDQ